MSYEDLLGVATFRPCVGQEDGEMTDVNEVVLAVEQALKGMNNIEVAVGARLIPLVDRECPLKSVKAYFVRAMDQAIEASKEVVG